MEPEQRKKKRRRSTPWNCLMPRVLIEVVDQISRMITILPLLLQGTVLRLVREMTSLLSCFDKLQQLFSSSATI